MAIPAVASVLAFVGSWVALSKHNDQGGIIAGLVCMVFTAMLAAVLVSRYHAKPDYVTAQNVDVFMGITKPWTTEMRPEVEAAIDRAINRWSAWSGKPDVVRGFVAKGSLHFTDQVMQDVGGPTGLARGLTSGNYMVVTCRKPPSEEPVAIVASLVEHECGHACLFALGVPDEQHHPLMAKLGSP